jgi:hypothetical protein
LRENERFFWRKKCTEIRANGERWARRRRRSRPRQQPILDDKGNLYGGTVLGGGDNDGLIFELTP